jgi:alanine dehydrogenase
MERRAVVVEKQTIIGFPRLHKEPGERRDFLPHFMAKLHSLSAIIMLEYGYGTEMGFSEKDYRNASPNVQFASRADIYQQDYVLALRCPTDDEMRLLHRGACLISMLHYPTRPKRVAMLRSLGVEAISLDSLKDDSGRRLVENLRAVGWNGVEVAFQTLRPIYPAPGFESPQRPPIQVTVLGAGAVGSHAIQAAVNYGNPRIRQELANNNVLGVQVTVVDFDLTAHADVMKPILSSTDILIDATQRPDTTKPVIPNSWVGWLPRHAVLLDLSVDPYDCSSETRSVKGIEGIPHGNLSHLVFSPDDPDFDELPACVDTANRRWSVSCYSWPGIYPKGCMELYGKQIQPIMRTLIEKGGVQNINPQGRYFERAIGRAMLSLWPESLENNTNHKGEHAHERHT